MPSPSPPYLRGHNPSPKHAPTRPTQSPLVPPSPAPTLAAHHRHSLPPPPFPPRARFSFACIGTLPYPPPRCDPNTPPPQAPSLRRHDSLLPCARSSTTQADGRECLLFGE
ncbi:hypothetical protein Salat_0650800 [Sesamum alatum]|uniref:Uncharacterized protein n=1 Tax=Sesamum alatum TaxID=300844 RepID=A0AAE1YQT7_9LAMI|nr:hypothetical protein Salat_0650800 [Sesamum alatum]